MRKIITMLALTLLTVASVVAQVPQGFNYQAVVRNAQGELVASATVGVRISLLQGSATGNVVYAETHNPQTNAGGLFTIVIGQGDSATGSLAAINWANGPYFISSEVDPEGGNNYTVNAVQQLLSVPYAMYAGSAANAGDVTRAYVDSAVAAIEVPAAGVTRGYVDSAVAALSMTGGATVVYDGERDTVICGGEDDWYGTESWIDLYVEAGIMHFYQMNYTILRPEYHDTTVITDSSSYVWHGETYTSNGSYYWYGDNTTNCVVEHLNLILNASSSNVIVTFGNDTWSAQGIEAYYATGENAYFDIWVSNDGTFENFPIANVYTDGIGSGSYEAYGEYYETYTFYDGDNNTHGDWIPVNNFGTANFTMFDTVNNLASGTINITLYSLYEAYLHWQDGNTNYAIEDCESRQLTITFTNIPMTNVNAVDTTTIDTTTVNPNPGDDTLSNITIVIGENVYNPGWSSAVYYPEYNAITIDIAQRMENNSVYFPWFRGFIEGEELTTGTYSVQNYAPDLFESTYYSDDNQYYGDWQYYNNGTYTITAIDFIAGTISGTFSATMYSLTDIVENGVETPDEATHSQLTIQFNNVPLSTYGSSTSAAPTTLPVSMYRSDIAMPRTVTPRRANLNF